MTRKSTPDTPASPQGKTQSAPIHTDKPWCLHIYHASPQEFPLAADFAENARHLSTPFTKSQHCTYEHIHTQARNILLAFFEWDAIERDTLILPTREIATQAAHIIKDTLREKHPNTHYAIAISPLISTFKIELRPNNNPKKLKWFEKELAQATHTFTETPDTAPDTINACFHDTITTDKTSPRYHKNFKKTTQEIAKTNKISIRKIEQLDYYWPTTQTPASHHAQLLHHKTKNDEEALRQIAEGGQDRLKPKV